MHGDEEGQLSTEVDTQGIEALTLSEARHRVFRLSYRPGDTSVFFKMFIERDYMYTDEDDARDDEVAPTTSSERLEAWLLKNRPSRQRPDGSKSVMMYMGRIDRDVQLSLEEEQQRCQLVWKEFQQERMVSAEHKLTLGDMISLAQKMELMSGAWMIYINDKEPRRNATWRLLCRALHEHLLPEYCVLRLITYQNKEWKRLEVENCQLIMVYNQDFTDMEQVLSVEKALRDIGITKNLKYKPNIFGFLQVHGDNELDIRPSIYMSKWIFRKRHSRISTDY